MYRAINEREEEVDNAILIPTNHGSAGYVEYIEGKKVYDVTDPSHIKLPSIPDDWKAKNQILHIRSQSLLMWIILVLGQSIVSIRGLKGKGIKGSMHNIHYRLV